MNTRRALLALLLAGCHRPAGPDRVVDEYFAHLKAGRIADAYALTTPEYRARRTQAAFAIEAARLPLLERGERRRAERTMAIELGDVRVLVEHGRASLAEDPLDLYPSESPEKALRSFARAVRLARRERIAPLLAPHLRERLQAAGELLPPIVELARLIEHRLQQPLGPLVTDGTNTSWLLGDARAVSLERGPRGWWITSF